MSNTLFTDDQSGEKPTESFIEKVVAAKGETFKDPEAIAKGYLASQEHILKLEAENAQLKESSTKNDYMKEVLDRIDAGKSKPTSEEPVSENTGEGTADNQGVTTDQIKDLITATLTQQEAERTASGNLAKTKELMQDAFGTEASKVLLQKQAELGMSKERLDQLASESPTAFMQLMGKAPKKEDNKTVPTSVVQISEGSGKRDWAYYQKLRRENSKLYYSAEIQNQLMKDRLELGDAFGL